MHGAQAILIFCFMRRLERISAYLDKRGESNTTGLGLGYQRQNVPRDIIIITAGFDRRKGKCLQPTGAHGSSMHSSRKRVKPLKKT